MYMNKDKFEVMRDQYNAIAPKIGHSINKLIFKVKDTGRGKFEEMECSRDNVGKVCFMDTFEKKHFPDFFYQIGKDGYLSHPEIDSLERILPRFKTY